MKMCEMNYFSFFFKPYWVLFLTFIIGTQILCCTTTDLGIFGTAVGIFGVGFVRALWLEYNIVTKEKRSSMLSRYLDSKPREVTLLHSKIKVEL